MKWTIGIAFVAVMLFSPNAFSQTENACSELPYACGVITSTTSSTTLVIVGGIALTIILVAKDRKRALRSYLRENALAVRNDAHLGEGATLHDLRLFLAIPDRQHAEFARWIRTERQTIDVLLSDGARDEQFDAFLFLTTARFGT